MNAPARRNLPAAVIEEGAAGSQDIVKVIPKDACRLRVGRAILGYRIPGGWNRLATIRLREIERIISLRYGPGGCDTDDGSAYAILAAHCLIPRLLESHAGRAGVLALVVDRFAVWCTRYVPELGHGEVQRIAERAIKEPRQFRADSAARLIRLTMAERTAARVTTIGAIDCNAEVRKAIRRDAARLRDRERKADARRAAGARTKLEVQANSVAARCKELGISRATFYRRMKASQIEAEAPRDTRVQQHNDENHVGGHDCLTPPAAKPHPPSRREPFRYYPAPSACLTVPEPEPGGRRASLAARRDDPPDDPQDLSDQEWALIYVQALSA